MLKLKPTQTRYVEVHHESWGSLWHLQFPESIGFLDGWIMDFQPIHPQWQWRSDGALFYEWLADEQYVQEQAAHQMQQLDARAEKKQFVAGVHLEAVLQTEGNQLTLQLSLTNRSEQLLRQVVCDGGCFQAKSPEFTGANEVERTFITAAEHMTPLSQLSRTQHERCVYHTDLSAYDTPPDKGGEWFWGRSKDTVTAPVILAMKTVAGDKAVALGYEGARSGSANADEHHCMHSRPFFGDLRPGETVTRTGKIVFDTVVETAVQTVLEAIT